MESSTLASCSKNSTQSNQPRRIGIALAIFLIGMLIWKKCFSKPKPMEATLLSPSAPLLPASNQPQRPFATPVTNNQATKSNASIPIHINIL